MNKTITDISYRPKSVVLNTTNKKYEFKAPLTFINEFSYLLWLSLTIKK